MLRLIGALAHIILSAGLLGYAAVFFWLLCRRRGIEDVWPALIFGAAVAIIWMAVWLALLVGGAPWPR